MAAASPPAEQAAALAPAGFALRRPLVGRSGQVAGFELWLPEPVQRRMQQRGDAATEAAHHLALLAAAAPLARGERPVLVRLAAALLQRPALATAVPAGVWVAVDKLDALAPDLLAGLRGRGIRLGALDGPPLQQPAPDFVALQAPGGAMDTLLLSHQRWLERWPRLPALALGLEHLDDVERALRGGMAMAGGRLARSALPPTRRELGAAAHRICELLNHLQMDHEVAVIGQAVRADVALTYRLLRYANSPAIGLSRAVDSVEQAVAILGRAELYRWLSVLLLSAAGERQASRALQEDALARGRLLEGVARRRGEPEPGALFTLGLFSMLEALLSVPADAALAPLRLGEAAQAALLHRQGPWADHLALLDALEAGDAERTDALAQGLGVAAVLPELLEDAWRWAEAMTPAAASKTRHEGKPAR